MTTTTTEAPAAPVLGEIIVRTHDNAKVVEWTLGHRGVITGLTALGIAAAARASAEFLEGLSDAERRALDHRGGATQIRIGAVDWSMPLIPHLVTDIEAMMIEVVNAEGSIGRIG
jgi:hypothetical protein